MCPKGSFLGDLNVQVKICFGEDEEENAATPSFALQGFGLAKVVKTCSWPWAWTSAGVQFPELADHSLGLLEVGRHRKLQS